MPAPLTIVLSLVCVLFVQLLLQLRKIARNVGNLSGPFFLVHPISRHGYFIGRLTRPIPYIHLGTSWMLHRKYEGMGPKLEKPV